MVISSIYAGPIAEADERRDAHNPQRVVLFLYADAGSRLTANFVKEA